ncbi:Gypsy retrotransposon integrase-like protein 1 [Elysia marginata]|uniref:Gypsy retrotransposon integrase-like protein 1 n=1 Tax=Elysia marginata TaxID=1093978 RepID=A0AAV4JNH2_9GAST|nr:Gypsy retrotransposon integrase-like protein 1 [Elysia marginata]
MLAEFCREDGKLFPSRRRGGIVYRRYEDPGYSVSIKQVVLPKSLRKYVMSVAHDSLTQAHLGIRRTKGKVLINFYWPKVDSDVTRYCRSCDVCQQKVKKGIVPKVPLEKVPLFETPFKRVAMDMEVPINLPSEAGHRLILILIDCATKYAEAVPLCKIDTETVAEAFVDIYRRLGVPEEVLNDQGTQFMSDCMKKVFRPIGIKQKGTTPYHPMSKGQVERFNATLKTCVRRLCGEQPRQWHRYINPLLFAFRDVPQESTHFAPYELLYGRPVRGTMHILRELWTNDVEETEVKSSYEYVLNLRERLNDTLTIAREELEKAKERQKYYHDRTAKRRKFSLREKGLGLLPTDSNKLLTQWKGTFEVVATVGVNGYRINMGGKVKTFHANLLKRCIARDHEPIVNGDIEGELFNDSDCETLPELGGWGSNETVNDLEYGDILTSDQQRQLEEIASSYSSIFSGRPGTVSTKEHRIDLTSSTPVRKRPYPVPYAMRQTLRDELRKMENMEIIRNSSSPCSSPVVVAGRKTVPILCALTTSR